VLFTDTVNSTNHNATTPVATNEQLRFEPPVTARTMEWIQADSTSTTAVKYDNTVTAVCSLHKIGWLCAFQLYQIRAQIRNLSDQQHDCVEDKNVDRMSKKHRNWPIRSHSSTHRPRLIAAWDTKKIPREHLNHQVPADTVNTKSNKIQSTQIYETHSVNMNKFERCKIIASGNLPALDMPMERVPTH
jgi:hypothetical protein